MSEKKLFQVDFLILMNFKGFMNERRIKIKKNCMSNDLEAAFYSIKVGLNEIYH